MAEKRSDEKQHSSRKDRGTEEGDAGASPPPVVDQGTRGGPDGQWDSDAAGDGSPWAEDLPARSRR